MEEQGLTTEGIAPQVTAVIAFKVGNAPQGIVNAASGSTPIQGQMSVLTRRIFAGHPRSIVGSIIPASVTPISALRHPT